MGRTVAIDGPSGAGKSTLAKALAERLGFVYLDTGALYRAVALGLLKHGISPEDDDRAIEEALGKFKISYTDGKVYLDGEDVSEKIRTTEAGHYSSVFSARRPVRKHLMPLQRDAAREQDIVAEGRDMATVVFPEAWRKFYLDASVEARAGRRYRQLKEAGAEISMEQAHEDVAMRDKRDSTRDIAPLKRATDAVYIDSSNLNADETLLAVMKAVEG